MISLVIAAVLNAQPCIKPIHHAHGAPVQTCIIDGHAILAMPPPPVDAPIEPVTFDRPLVKYAVLTYEEPCLYTRGGPMGGSAGGPSFASLVPTGGGSLWTKAPELDTSGGVVSVTLLACALLMVRGQRK